ncbi:histidinol-phosphatase HisJ [Halobacillus salinus]|uniref:histidinol-phosphatase HisJ n=1 Tax=Halobacillus salinus TaxID=192814 RepID=UPI0009A5E144|nr:histidinol-phosphatase HisJ [Halobacillus salinus]
MKDGHIHTPYCPHGSKDVLKSYIEQAISSGYKSMTFTEHAPLPESFQDPVPDKDSAMDIRDVDQYISDLQELKKEYKKDLSILIGFEVDYIRGYENETKHFLDDYGPYLDDGILSVHFLEGNKAWYCLDFSPSMFQEATEDFGSIDRIYNTYFDHVTSSIQCDLGPFKPNRIGHMTLIRKFHELYPSPPNWERLATPVLQAAKHHGMELDYNGAGTKKPHCNETYPTKSIAEHAIAMEIPLVYGSDAHHSLGIKQGYDKLSSKFFKS